MIETDYSKLQAIILHGGAIREGVRFLGIVAPDTDGFLAVDERYRAYSDEMEDSPAVWAVTHIPTMRRLQKTGYTDAETEQEAFALAKRLYSALRKIGTDLSCADPEAILLPYKAMDKATAEEFWTEVKGSAPRTEGKDGE